MQDWNKIEQTEKNKDRKQTSSWYWNHEYDQKRNLLCWLQMEFLKKMSQWIWLKKKNQTKKKQNKTKQNKTNKQTKKQCPKVQNLGAFLPFFLKNTQTEQNCAFKCNCFNWFFYCVQLLSVFFFLVWYQNTNHNYLKISLFYLFFPVINET